jgi:tartrate dehydratase alpha subunit/fumarate hydratase class I-like protein
VNSLLDPEYLGLTAIKSRTAVAIRDPTGSSHVHVKNTGIFETGGCAKTLAVIIARMARHIASLFISLSHTAAYL